MKAKEMITHVVEGNLEPIDNKPTAPEIRPSGPPRPGGPSGGPPRPGARPPRGAPEEPVGQFNGREIDQIKDLVILMLAGVMRSDMDTAIAQKLMKKEPLDPGELRHILDEASSHVQGIPETHRAVMEKIYNLSK